MRMLNLEISFGNSKRSSGHLVRVFAVLSESKATSGAGYSAVWYI